MKSRGLPEIRRQLKQLENSRIAIAAAALRKAGAVLARAARQASPGSIGLEIAARVFVDGDIVRAKVGLEVAGMRSKRPHGRFLTGGTRYIVARHFVRNAFNGAMGTAMSAARRGAKRRLDKELHSI